MAHLNGRPLRMTALVLTVEQCLRSGLRGITSMTTPTGFRIIRYGVGSIAERFAGRPEVAGMICSMSQRHPYQQQSCYLCTKGYSPHISEIQEAESNADFQHLLFIEPTIPAGEGAMGLGIPDPERMGVQNQNIVNATHNYAESIEIGGLSLEQTNSLLVALAQTQQTPLWIGEYGFWSTEPEILSIAERFAADEDNHGLGGAWWQWRQPCGDPHSLHLVDGEWTL